MQINITKPKDRRLNFARSKGTFFKTLLLLSLFFITIFGTIINIKFDGNDYIQDLEPGSLNAAADGIDNLVFFDDFSDHNYDDWTVINGTWDTYDAYLSSEGPSVIQRPLSSSYPFNNLSLDFDYRFENLFGSGYQSQTIDMIFIVDENTFFSVSIDTHNETYCFLMVTERIYESTPCLLTTDPFPVNEYWFTINITIVDNKLTVFNEGIKYIDQFLVAELENWSFSTLRIVFGGGQEFCVRNIDNISLKSSKQMHPNVPNAPYLNEISSPSTTGNITLSWNWVQGASSYKIYRSNSFISSVAALQPIETDYQMLSYEDIGLANGTYYYVVVATNASGDSEMSNWRMVTVGTVSDQDSNTSTMSPITIPAIVVAVIAGGLSLGSVLYKNRKKNIKIKKVKIAQSNLGIENFFDFDES